MLKNFALALTALAGFAFCALPAAAEMTALPKNVQQDIAAPERWRDVRRHGEDVGERDEGGRAGGVNAHVAGPEGSGHAPVRAEQVDGDGVRVDHLAGRLG